MAFTTDILASYLHPARAVRRILAGPVREDRALIMLMGAAAIIFVAQWPVAARTAHFDTSVPLEARLSGMLLATVFLMPLAAYALAGASHIIMRSFGGQGTFYGARIALFWALLAVSPIMLFQGLVAGMIGPGPALSVTGMIIFAGFIWIWGAGLYVAEFGAL
jgi:hypothetical protein